MAITYSTAPRRGLYFTAPDKDYPKKPLQAWTQGQDEDSRHWYPCIDYPNHQQTSEVLVTVPASMISIGNGALKSVKENKRNGTKTYHWQQDIPHVTYLLSQIVGTFAEIRHRSDGPRGGTPGPLVAPGSYIIRLVAANRTFEQKVEVREDPRIDISPAERKQWADAVQQAAALARQFGPVNDRIQKIPMGGADVADLKRQSRELTSRIGSLYGAIGRWTGAPTKDQLSRLAYYQTMAKQLTAKAP